MQAINQLHQCRHMALTLCPCHCSRGAPLNQHYHISGTRTHIHCHTLLEHNMTRSPPVPMDTDVSDADTGSRCQIPRNEDF